MGAAVLVLRGLLAAVAIAVSVWLAARGGAIAAGVASCFPAIFFTTMVSLWVSQGHAVPAGAAGPMMLGSVSVAVYALLVTLWVPTMGVFYGCGISWVVAALGASLPAVWWLRRRSGVVSLE